MKIIPAIDLLEGKVVRLTQGKFDDVKIYSNNPLEQIKIFEEYGFNMIHIVDLSGSKYGKISTIKILEEIKNKSKIKIQFGGGIRSLKDMNILLQLGIDKIVIGSLPFTNRNEFLKIADAVPNEKIILAADTLRNDVVVKGWLEKAKMSVNTFISEWFNYGIKNFLVTDTEKDGMLEGPNINLYSKLISSFPEINLLASGGIKDIDDIKKISECNIGAVIIGKAIYENKIDIKELLKLDK